MTPRDYWLGWSVGFLVLIVLIRIGVLERLDHIIALLEKMQK